MTVTVPPKQNLNQPTSLHGFKLLRIQVIEELNATAYEFVHEKNGARVLHLYNDDPNNLFSIAFRTPVHDSTGVPHILEHSVLCGSKKFPIKDPFQELLKGSLQTFLNALTYPDKTVYPVSSQVEKDYYNLVDVYCDAVFNPLLTENTFYQEGWHFDVEDVSKPVGIKGIVYNEMKGVFSTFSSHVDRKSLSSLFPDISYFHESGGEPDQITNLTYEQFREFHRRYYHPSNSFVFLYGNLSSEKTLKFLNEQYIGKFDRLEIDSAILLQKHWSVPREQSITAPSSKEDDGTATVAVLWIFGATSDPLLTLAGKVLTHYLLGTESSPLKRALIDSGLGEDLDDISGFESDLVQTIFAAGLRKSRSELAHKVLDCILVALRKEVEEGLDAKLLEGALRQIEFSLREVTGGHFPYNLRLAERCYRSWIYNGDPLAHLAFEKPLAIIKEEHAKGQTFFKNLIRDHLLENPHRLLSTVIASSEMGKQLELQTEAHAAALTANFTADDKNRYAVLTAELLSQQKTPPSPKALATLPKLDKKDLPPHGRVVPTAIKPLHDGALHLHDIFTSGIVYVDCGFDLRGIPADLIPYLSFYSELITRCGAGGTDYEEMSRDIALATGGIDASVTCKTFFGSENELMYFSFISGKALVPRCGEMLDIISKLLLTLQLDNAKQIRDILREERNGMQASVVNSGHYLAIANAASNLSLSRHIDEQMAGVTQLRFLDSLVRRDAINEIIEAMQRIHKLIVTQKRCVVSVTLDNPVRVESQIVSFISSLPETDITPVQQHHTITIPQKMKGVEISSAVNFVGKVWKTPPVTSQNAGILFLISRYLSTGYLWDKVRVEGGAYGGLATMSTAHPVFACASYRDPNLKKTIEHFDNGLREIASGLPQDKIDQSIIGSVGKIDSPLSPHAQGFGDTINILSGYTNEHRQELREAVLGAGSDSLAKMASQILDTRECATSIFGSSAAFDQAEKEGLAFDRENLL